MGDAHTVGIVNQIVPLCSSCVRQKQGSSSDTRTVYELLAGDLRRLEVEFSPDTDDA